MALRLSWKAGTVLKRKGHRSIWGRKQKAVVAEWGLSISVKSWSHWNPGETSHGCSPQPYPGWSLRTSVWCHVGWWFQPHEKKHFHPLGLEVPTHHLCKSPISDPSFPTQSYPRSGKGSVFEIWFNTERNPLVRHHPPNHLFTIELWGCILQAGTCSSLRCPETSMPPVKPTGTWWDWRDSRDGGTGKGLKGTVSDEQAKFSKSSQAECTSRSGRTTQLAQKHSSSSTPAIMFIMDWNFSHIVECQIMSAFAMQTKKPHHSSRPISQSWRQLSRGDASGNTEFSERLRPGWGHG